MRRRLLTMTMMGVALTGVVHAQAITQVGVREVAASERGVISLATKIRYTTMIILPDTEEILDVLCGDKEFWVINASHNIAHLKPAKGRRGDKPESGDGERHSLFLPAGGR